MSSVRVHASKGESCAERGKFARRDPDDHSECVRNLFHDETLHESGVGCGALPGDGKMSAEATCEIRTGGGVSVKLTMWLLWSWSPCSSDLALAQ